MSTTITPTGKNMMGTIDLLLKAGNMRKAAGFVVYPRSSNAQEGDPLRLQSDNRVALLFPDGKLILSDAVATHPGFHILNIPWVKKFECRVDADQMAAVRAAVNPTASPKAGTNGLMYCDNTNAGLF